MRGFRELNLEYESQMDKLDDEEPNNPHARKIRQEERLMEEFEASQFLKGDNKWQD
jgi:hypothetical protein